MKKNNEKLRIAYIEPFMGGSHESTAKGWAAASKHEIIIESLPARFWKWRMRGAAFHFARKLETEKIDLLFVTDLIDLAHLHSFLPRKIPSILYFHENQASYPEQGGQTEERDLQFAFTNLASALAADLVAFNSVFQKKAFFDGMESLLRRMPDSRPLWALKSIEKKTRVLPPGVQLSDIPRRSKRSGNPPAILWNHRWEYDKNPEAFFNALFQLNDRGAAFRLLVAGESFGKAPKIFSTARRKLAAKIDHWGYCDRRTYASLLPGADIIVSTAIQENYGLSVVEAAFAGAHPLLPSRLSYPEVLPAALHENCLYGNESDLEAMLEKLLNSDENRIHPDRLRSLFSGFGWEARAGDFDDLARWVYAK